MTVKELIEILRDEPENSEVYIGWDRVNTAGLTAEDRVPYKVTGFRASHRTADGGVVEISVYAPPEFNYGNDDEGQGEPGNWYDDWEVVARTGDGDAVLKHRETEGLYRILPVEDQT